MTEDERLQDAVALPPTVDLLDFGNLVPDRIKADPNFLDSVREEERKQDRRMKNTGLPANHPRREPEPLNDDMDTFRARLRDRQRRMARVYNTNRGEWE